MPKENVHDIVIDGFRVEVGWTSQVADESDGYVQIATTNAASGLVLPPDDETAEQRVLRAQRNLARVQSAVAADVTHAARFVDGGNYPPVTTSNAANAIVLNPEDGQPFDGWHVTLDRDALNRLIRVLRRARDRAFGADA